MSRFAHPNVPIVIFIPASVRIRKQGIWMRWNRRCLAGKNRGLKADTVFFGGGTPSLLTPSELERIVHAVKTNFALLPDAEVTMEANPETVDQAYLEAVAALGINRLSFGVQSAVDRELKALGRRHTYERARYRLFPMQKRLVFPISA